MDIFCQNIITRLSKSYLTTYQLGAESGNQETYENPAKKKVFKDQFAKLCLLEQSLKDESNLISRFECTSVDEFDQNYKSALDEMKRNAPKANEIERFIKFCNDIDNVVLTPENDEALQDNIGTIDEDIQMNESQLVEIDPITKQTIRDPVRNVLCNHVYDRESIMKVLQANNRIKCAYVGCSNKKPVLLSHLKDDPHLKAKLKQIYTQRQERSLYGEDDEEAEQDT